jgi:hypothetical protein
MITEDQIKRLASRKGVKAIAVENFLGSIDCNADASTAFGNAAIDAKLYKWNAATVRAINDGIALHFKR